MKAQTKAIVASLAVIALALSAVSGITYSWFSDSESSNITISTSTYSVDVIERSIGYDSESGYSISGFQANSIKSITEKVTYKSSASAKYAAQIVIKSKLGTEELEHISISIGETEKTLGEWGFTDSGSLQTKVVSWNDKTTTDDLTEEYVWKISADAQYGDSKTQSSEIQIEFKYVIYQSDYPGAVNEPTLIITKNPSKMNYLPGEEFKSTGMIVTLYSDGTSHDVTDSVTVSPGTIPEGGKVSITYTFGSSTLTTELTVNVSLTIYTPDQLTFLSKNADSFNGKTIEIGSDLDMSAESGFKPINLTSGYSLSMDGKGKSISNIKYETVSNEYCGLFTGTAGNIEIKNLTLKDSEFKTTVSKPTDGSAGGAFVGFKDVSGKCHLTNCHAVNVSIQGFKFVGGLIGYSSSNDLKIENCSVEGNGATNISGYKPTGGIIGFSNGGDIGSKETPIMVKDIIISKTGSEANYPYDGLFVGRSAAGTTTIWADDVNVTMENRNEDMPGCGSAVSGTLCINGTYFVGNADSLKVLLSENGLLTNDEGYTQVKLLPGSYNIVGTEIPNHLELIGSENRSAKIIASTGGSQGIKTSKLVFEGLEFQYATAKYSGFIHSQDIQFTDCKITGMPFLYADQMTFTECDFYNSDGEYCIWTYASKNVTFKDCTFNTSGKAILIYNEGKITTQKITISDCAFKTSKANQSTSDLINMNCAAIEIDSRFCAFDLTLSNNNIQIDADSFSGEWRIKKFIKDVSVNEKTYDGLYVDDKKIESVTDENGKTKVVSINGVPFMDKSSFKNAITENTENIEIDLQNDVAYDTTAWNGLSLGGDSTKTITINGNGHKVTFRNTNSDWNNIVSGAKLILKNMIIDNSGYNADGGPWNSHDIIFNCDVEMEDVTCLNAVAFYKTTILKKVTISDSYATQDTYVVWIMAGANVTMEDCTINGKSLTGHANRAIKIGDEYVNGSVEELQKEENVTTLKLSKCTITADKYSLAMVSNVGQTKIIIDQESPSTFNGDEITADSKIIICDNSGLANPRDKLGKDYSEFKDQITTTGVGMKMRS